MVLRPHRRHMGSSIFEKIMMLQSNCYRGEDQMNNGFKLYEQK